MEGGVGGAVGVVGQQISLTLGYAEHSVAVPPPSGWRVSVCDCSRMIPFCICRATWKCAPAEDLLDTTAHDFVDVNHKDT